MRRVRKDCKFTIDENYSSIKTLTSILILANFVGQIYSTVVPSAFPQQNHDQAVGENMELVGETETDFRRLFYFYFELVANPFTYRLCAVAREKSEAAFHLFAQAYI